MKKLSLLAAAAVLAMSAGAADYYLIGEFNGWTLSDPSAKFSPQADGNYTLEISELTSKFKINDGTWANPDANFGGSTPLVVDQLYTLDRDGNSRDITMANSVTNAHLTFNPDAGTLLVTGNAGQVTPTPSAETLYVVGDMTGWSADPSYKMTKNGNVYTLTLPNGLNGEWKINNGTWDMNFGAGDEQPVEGVE
ncbi:MAG: hypothetical protein K2J15_05635, partial [Muribaculaceae bacterium]|nr:hypothetical protein [Muribaculaceae bacterium]